MAVPNARERITLQSGREVEIGPLKWMAFEPLMGEVFKVYMDRLKDVGAVSQGPQFMVAAVYAMLGEPQRWMHCAATTIASWLAWGSIYDPKIDIMLGKPDLSDFTAAEVAEVMQHAARLNDFKAIAEQLKNSLGPVADDIAGLSMTGQQTSQNDEEPSEAANSPSEG